MATSLSEPPLFAALADSRRVLIAGAGGGFTDYFPERTLARWLKTVGEPATVYSFQRTGVEPL